VRKWLANNHDHTKEKLVLITQQYKSASNKGKLQAMKACIQSLLDEEHKFMMVNIRFLKVNADAEVVVKVFEDIDEIYDIEFSKTK